MVNRPRDDWRDPRVILLDTITLGRCITMISLASTIVVVRRPRGDSYMSYRSMFVRHHDCAQVDQVQDDLPMSR